MKKIKFLIAIVFIATAFLVMQSSAPPPPPGTTLDVDPRVETLEQTPPDVKTVWVQKLLNPPSGKTMLIQIELDDYVCYDTLSDTVNLYWGDLATNKITFYDNAANGDNIANDGIFSAYINQNVTSFRSQVISREAALTSNGGYIKFTGHEGEEITEFDHFDIGAFDAGSVTKLPDHVLHAIFCGAILRENSLFITDLSVVEDPARTYNVRNLVAGPTGNPTGKWTFGEMFRNMAGTSVAPKDLAKSWLQHWIADFTLNGQTVQRRGDAIRLFIGPWLQKAGCTTAVTVTNWDDCWDEVDEDDLMVNAPFKLTAIVNRLDLRGNSSYSLSIVNSGETRFIFTLIDYTTGAPVLQDNVINTGSTPAFVPRFLDWRGMNVIFEYGNVQDTRCGVKGLAQQWVDLSSLSLGSPAYLSALEDITDYVTLANAAPRINGSAINRIRTNEKIFHQMEGAGPPLGEDNSWAHADWEFRQFELDASSHLFKQVPLTNSIINYANTASSLIPNAFHQELRHSDPGTYTFYFGDMQGRISSPGYPYSSFNLQGNFTDWLFNPFVKANLLRGSHNAPTTYRGNPFLAASTFDIGEFSHYWEYKNDENTEYYSASGTYPEADQLRFQYSSNTCEGCHTGETKTIFTHIQPLAYRETARYWTSVPDAKLDELDTRPLASYNSRSFFSPSIGVYAPPAMGVPYHYYQNVSAFLTGSRYSGTASAPTYEDDDPTDANDNNMEGLFYVYDPSGLPSNTVSTHGFNDLLRRRDDLCSLINTPCNSLDLFGLLKNIKFIPLGLGAH